MFFGFNPRISNTISGFQAGLAGLNGVLDILEAKNNGETTSQAVSKGIGNAAFGIFNAYLGNTIDNNTYSYFGTTMNSVLSSGARRPSDVTPNLAGTALYTSFMPSMFGYNPFMMGSMYGGGSFNMNFRNPFWGGGLGYYC